MFALAPNSLDAQVPDRGDSEGQFELRYEVRDAPGRRRQSVYFFGGIELLLGRLGQLRQPDILVRIVGREAVSVGENQRLELMKLEQAGDKA